MPLNISDNSKIASLKEVLSLGKTYFETIDALYPYIGSDQKAYDATEILLLLIGMNGKYTQRSNIIDLLCMNENKVKKAITLLKSEGFIASQKKGLIVCKGFPIYKKCSTDEAFKLYALLHSLDDWYSSMAEHWKVMTLIHTIESSVDINIADCSKRHFAIALCKGSVEGFTYEKTKQFNNALSKLNSSDLADRYCSDNYREAMEKKYELDKKKKRCLADYQKAKLLLINPSMWKYIPNTIPKVSKEAFKLSVEYFPFNDNETKKDTINKRNIYIYEYLVRQQCYEDTDFHPMSPFYGKPLEERFDNNGSSHPDSVRFCARDYSYLTAYVVNTLQKKKDRTDCGVNWITLLMKGNLVFAGIKLDVQESVLRYLLIERKRYYMNNKGPVPKSYYIRYNGDGFETGKFEKNQQIFLEALGIECLDLAPGEKLSDVFKDLKR